MNPAYTSQVTVGMLLLILSSVLTVGMLLVFVAIQYVHRRKKRKGGGQQADVFLPGGFAAPIFHNPPRWLVIRSGNPGAVQHALDLHNAKRCSWKEGFSRLSDQALFISPPIDGWLFVVGLGLPDPADDVDECFRFISKLSREIGHVQFFSANRVVDHHAWVKAQNGRIVRAYAWAGETLWNQGRMTLPELELGMECFDYGQSPGAEFQTGVGTQSNADKVPLLAGRWSIDPYSLDQRRLSAGEGISGDLLRLG